MPARDAPCWAVVHILHTSPIHRGRNGSNTPYRAVRSTSPTPAAVAASSAERGLPKVIPLRSRTSRRPEQVGGSALQPALRDGAGADRRYLGTCRGSPGALHLAGQRLQAVRGANGGQAGGGRPMGPSGPIPDPELTGWFATCSRRVYPHISGRGQAVLRLPGPRLITGVTGWVQNRVPAPPRGYGRRAAPTPALGGTGATGAVKDVSRRPDDRRCRPRVLGGAGRRAQAPRRRGLCLPGQAALSCGEVEPGAVAGARAERAQLGHRRRRDAAAHA